MSAHDFLKMSEQDLLNRADQCLERAGSALEPRPHGLDHEARLHLFLEAQSCLSEVLRRQAEQAAARDRKRNEEIAERDFRLERLVVWLIAAEIFVSLVFGCFGIYEGIKQANVLDRMDTSAAATATAMQTARDSLKTLSDAQAASLKILQQEQAERARKPRLVMYAGNVPLDRASVHPKVVSGSAQTQAPLDLFIKNKGDAPVTMFRIHAVMPSEVIVFSEQQLIDVPEAEPPADPKTRRVTLQFPLLPAGDKVRIHTEVYVPKGYPSFKITFTVDALELRAVAPLGTLVVLPPKP